MRRQWRCTVSCRFPFTVPKLIFVHPVVSDRNILKIFKYEDEQDVEDIQYVTFLIMARAGLKALEYYDPAKKKHGQAHMQARCVPSFLVPVPHLTGVS